MSTSVKTLLIAATLAGGVAAGLAYANPPGDGERCGHGARAMGFGRHGMDPDAHLDRMVEALDLGKEQRDKVRAVVDRSRSQTRELRDQIADNHKQLRALMQQDAVKEAEVRKLAEIQGKLMADMIVQHARVQTEIRTVLTPEQREKMRQRFEHRGPFSSAEPQAEPSGLGGERAPGRHGPGWARVST